MNLSNALSLLLQNEAKRSARTRALFDITLSNRNAEHFPSNDTWWRTGSLCIAMLNHNPSVTTVMIVVGAKENKRYAITAEPTPVLVEFSTDDMKEVNMRLAKTSTEKDTKLFVTSACAIPLKRGTRIVPLRTEYVKYAFSETNEPRHPYEFYSAIKNIKTPGIRMIQAWAKAAALKTTSDAVRSAIELKPTRLSQFEDRTAFQVFRDITDAFTDQEHDHVDFIDALLKSIFPLVRQEPDDLPPVQAPPGPHQPQAARTENQVDDDSEVEDVTPPGANRDIPRETPTRPTNHENQQQADFHNRNANTSEHFPATNDDRRKRRSDPLSPNSEQHRGRSSVRWNNDNSDDDLNWPSLNDHDNRRHSQDRQQRTSYDHTRNNESAWDNSHRTGTTRSAWNQTPHTPQTRSIGRHPYQHTNSNPFSTRASSRSSPFDYVDASDASIKLKQLTDLASSRPLTTQEMNQWKVLHATIPKIHQTTAEGNTADSKTPFMGMKQFSVFAWAKTHPKDKRFLNDWNNHFWPKLNNCKNKSDARHVVDTEMFQPLLRRNPKLINCLHDDLKEAIVTFSFKPNNLQSDKPTLGLGPLAFVPRERKEIEMMSQQLALIEAATNNYTTDHEKVKLGRPKIPTNVDGYNSVIEACKDVNDFLFTDRCDFVFLLRASLLALYENYHAYEHMEYFGRTIGAELLFQLTRAAEQLFGTATSEQQLLDGILPSLDFDFLINGIRNNNLNTSQSRPALFIPAPKTARIQPQTPSPRGDRNRDRGGGGNNRGGNTPSPPKTGNNSVSRKLPDGMHKLLSEWKKNNNKSRLPSIHDFRTASALADDEALQSLLNLNKSTCIRYALFGSCRSNCKRDHPSDITGFNATAAETVLRKGLPE